MAGLVGEHPRLRQEFVRQSRGLIATPERNQSNRMETKVVKPAERSAHDARFIREFLKLFGRDERLAIDVMQREIVRPGCVGLFEPLQRVGKFAAQ